METKNDIFAYQGLASYRVSTAPCMKAGGGKQSLRYIRENGGNVGGVERDRREGGEQAVILPVVSARSGNLLVDLGVP